MTTRMRRHGLIARFSTSDMSTSGTWEGLDLPAVSLRKGRWGSTTRSAFCFFFFVMNVKVYGMYKSVNLGDCRPSPGPRVVRN